MDPPTTHTHVRAMHSVRLCSIPAHTCSSSAAGPQYSHTPRWADPHTCVHTPTRNAFQGLLWPRQPVIDCNRDTNRDTSPTRNTSPHLQQLRCRAAELPQVKVCEAGEGGEGGGHGVHDAQLGFKVINVLSWSTAGVGIPYTIVYIYYYIDYYFLFKSQY